MVLFIILLLYIIIIISEFKKNYKSELEIGEVVICHSRAIAWSTHA